LDRFHANNIRNTRQLVRFSLVSNAFRHGADFGLAL
jgi:hypothetical protein